MSQQDVAACVDDLVTRTISDAAGDYPGVHTREGVIGDRMLRSELDRSACERLDLEGQ